MYELQRIAVVVLGRVNRPQRRCHPSRQEYRYLGAEAPAARPDRLLEAPEVHPFHKLQGKVRLSVDRSGFQDAHYIGVVDGAVELGLVNE